jgi:hypothetical protein
LRIGRPPRFEQPLARLTGWRTLGRNEQGGGPVSEQPNDLVVESMDEAPVAAEPIHHEHVRTQGETAVDDALGATDDPTDS